MQRIRGREGKAERKRDGEGKEGWGRRRRAGSCDGAVAEKRRERGSGGNKSQQHRRLYRALTEHCEYVGVWEESGEGKGGGGRREIGQINYTGAVADPPAGMVMDSGCMRCYPEWRKPFFAVASTLQTEQLAAK